jgi:XTP/dITP diphosphohydrolase
MVRLLIATRSRHKLREIRTILGEVPGLDLVDLPGAAVPRSEAEEGIERFDTFEENARAKAAYFRDITGLPTVADDSGLVVDALDGGPGVRSKRFAPGTEGLEPDERDRRNNEHLLELLGDLPLRARTARYVCVAALARADGRVETFRGGVEGRILDGPRGQGGFGYDPLFFHPGLDRTFGQATPEEKEAESHRGQAFRALARFLRSEWGVQP